MCATIWTGVLACGVAWNDANDSGAPRMVLAAR